MTRIKVETKIVDYDVALNTAEQSISEQPEVVVEEPQPEAAKVIRRNRTSKRRVGR